MKKGRPQLYSSDAIKTVFHLPLRSLQGFLISLIALLGIYPESGEVMIAELTSNGKGSGDGEVAKDPALIKRNDSVLEIHGLGEADEARKC